MTIINNSIFRTCSRRPAAYEYMTRDYVSVQEGASVREAMRSLVRQAGERENVSTIYVVDAAGILTGSIELARLIRAREGDALASVTERDIPAVNIGEDAAGCAARLRALGAEGAPVVDGMGRLRGALTAVELARIESGAMDEDYARLGGLTEGEDLCEPLRASVRKRLPWLLALLALGLVVSSVVGAFEQVVSRLPLIISFQSLVLDMAGNVGTQSLAVTIRVLTDRRAGRAQKLRLLAKETRVGAANGLALAVLSVAFIGLYLVLFKGQDAALALSVAFCTSVALAVSIVLSSAAGTVIPLVFDRLHIDPAVASGPLITTVNDLIAVVTYYGLAWLLLMRAV
ncbi:MAG TPA: magnesium transporter [Candidatus Scatomorpha stercorigallinarum]|nr:magnesium transporter [Candidatus Scatomorpha stercorigallinarum]